MAILTPLALVDVAALGHAYGRDIVAMKGLLAGSVNSNFALEAATGERLFLRVYEEQTVETAKREATLLAALARAGVPTPEPFFRTDGAGFISTVRDKPAALFPFIEGEILCQKRVTERAAREVGRSLAEVHAAGREPSLAGCVGATRFDRAGVAARLQSLPTDVSDDIRAAQRRIARVLASPPPETPVAGVIHGDLFRDNVLFRDTGIVALLDFESASVGSYAFDLMVTILAWCFGDGLDARLASAMTEGYLAAVRFPPDELARFAQDLYPQGLFACARFATTRITDFELRSRDTGIYKDFRRFLRRMDAIEALGEGGLVTFLQVPGFAKVSKDD